MQIGIIGVGKMGSGLISRLISDKHEVVAFDKDPNILEKIKDKNVITTTNLDSFIKALNLLTGLAPYIVSPSFKKCRSLT